MIWPFGRTSNRPTYEGTFRSESGLAAGARLDPSNSKNLVGGTHSQTLSTGLAAMSTLPLGSRAAGASAATNCSALPVGGQLPGGSAIARKFGPLVQVRSLLS